LGNIKELSAFNTFNSLKNYNIICIKEFDQSWELLNGGYRD